MRFCLFLAAFLVFTGCGKKEAASSASSKTPAAGIPEPQSQPTGNEAQPAADTPAPRARAEAPALNSKANDAPPEPIAGAVHPFMTQQLRIFIQQTGRMPQTFSEFASARMDSVPRPPPGMKWVVDPATAEVKIVRQ